MNNPARYSFSTKNAGGLPMVKQGGIDVGTHIESDAEAHEHA
jgi:hypothetical protein